jgi:hypothetical protein
LDAGWHDHRYHGDRHRCRAGIGHLGRCGDCGTWGQVVAVERSPHFIRFARRESNPEAVMVTPMVMEIIAEKVHG